MKRAFTLIELLIVVAIIAILAAIAVPNFLEAQVRAKVARTMTDLRTIALALEAYKLDYSGRNGYPPNVAPQAGFRLIRITTPVAYLSSIPPDPFGTNTQYSAQYIPGVWNPDERHWNAHRLAYIYWRINCAPGGEWGNSYGVNQARKRGALWGCCGRGPNRSFDTYDIVQVRTQLGITKPDNLDFTYDASNGTLSIGDIERFGP